MIWTSEAQAALNQLFASQLAYTAIAQAMGVTKNTVSGRLWRRGMGRRKPLLTTSKERLDALDALLPRTGQCQFAELKGPFCGEKAEPGSAYCALHHKRVYGGRA